MVRTVAALIISVASLVLGCSHGATPAPAPVANAPSQSDTSSDSKYRITPRPDPAEPGGFYVPADLADAVNELDHMVTTQFRLEFAQDSDQPVRQHFGLGLWMRNNWGLWRGSRLSVFFNQLGVCHPDDMSGIILDSYWRRLNHLPLRVEHQVAAAKAYWRDQGVAQGCQKRQ